MTRDELTIGREFARILAARTGRRWEPKLAGRPPATANGEVDPGPALGNENPLRDPTPRPDEYALEGRR